MLWSWCPEVSHNIFDMHLIKELKIFGVGFQCCSHRGVVEDLAQFLGTFWIQISKVWVQGLGGAAEGLAGLSLILSRDCYRMSACCFLDTVEENWKMKEAYIYILSAKSQSASLFFVFQSTNKENTFSTKRYCLIFVFPHLPGKGC